METNDVPASASRRPPRGLAAVRVAFGLFWAVDAVFKWLPGFRHGYLASIKDSAMGQPHWLRGWFSFWVDLQSGHPGTWVTLLAVGETVVAAAVLLGAARRVSYPLGIVLSLLIWSVGEGFGGPYGSGVSDIGTAIVYALVFVALIVAAPVGSVDTHSFDGVMARRLPRWTVVSDFSRPAPAAATSSAAPRPTGSMTSG